MSDTKLSRFVERASTVTMAVATTMALFEVWRILFRNSQLFEPDRAPLTGWTPAPYGLDPALVDEVWFEAEDGTPLHAWYCRAPEPIASVLYCHGNSGNLTYSARNIGGLNAAGLNVFVFDYRGFGRSGGRATVSGVISDADAAARMHDEVRPKQLPSMIYGYSLGGAIAAQIARDFEFDGMVLQATFTNLRDMARLRYPKLPLHMIYGSDFDTLELVRELGIPLLVIHGTADEVIPCWMGESLHRGCTSARSIYLVDGAAHSDLYERDGTGIIEALQKFAVSLRAEDEQPEAEKKPRLVRLRSYFHRAVRKVRKVAVVLGVPNNPSPTSA